MTARKRSRAGRIKVAPREPASSNGSAAGHTQPAAVTRSRHAATWLAMVWASACGSDETRAESAPGVGGMGAGSFLRVAAAVLPQPAVQSQPVGQDAG